MTFKVRKWWIVEAENFSSNFKLPSGLFSKHFLLNTLISAGGKRRCPLYTVRNVSEVDSSFILVKLGRKNTIKSPSDSKIYGLSRALVPEALSWKQTTDKKYSPWRLYNGNIYKCTVSFSIFSLPPSPSPLSLIGLLSRVSKPRFRIFSSLPPPFF